MTEWTPEDIFLRNMSAPIRGVMKFTLVYQGKLSASANKSKTKEVFDIRAKLSPQLEMLWKTSRALAALQEVGWVRNPLGPQVGQIMTPHGEPSPRQRNEMMPGSYIPLFSGIPVGSSSYVPLVRGSLHLACDLDVLFLRQEDPGHLVTQGGDIDGRIKTLLDALRMPDQQEQQAAAVDGVQQFVLMESDALVTSLNVETERLLIAPPPSTPNEEAKDVFLVIEVSLRVLQVTAQNTCLL